MKSVDVFLGGEWASCHDCTDEWLLTSLGMTWNIIRWFYNPEPKRYPIHMLKVGKDDEGYEIYLCGKHWLKRQERS